MAASNESAAARARRFNLTKKTAAKWKKRFSFEKLPHTVHRLQTRPTGAGSAVE